MTSGTQAQGAFDTDLEVVGTILPMFGWVMFPSGPAVRVTAYVDGVACPARPAVPRGDLVPMFGAMAAAAGFQCWWEPRLAEGERRIVTAAVRAEGRHGEIWQTADRSITMSRPVGSASMAGADAELVRQADQLVGRTPVRTMHGAHDAPEAPRLCFFVHDLALGGGQLWMQDLLLRLAQEQSARIWVVSPQDGVLRAALEAVGITVHITGGYGVDPAHYAGRVVELAALLRLWAIDAVLVNTMGLLVAADAAVVAGLPFIWAIHESYGLAEYALLGLGISSIDPALERRWIAAMESATLMFVSDSTSELVGAYAPAAPCATVPYGIDRAAIDDFRATWDRDAQRAAWGWSRQDVVLLCMGVFGERKGNTALVLAFARVAASFPSARLVLVGSHGSPYCRLVEELVAGLGLADRIRIIPLVEDTYPWFASADVLVSASDVESLPRSMIEALAFGLPIASVDVFGIGELVVEGETGWLCRPRDIDALATCLRRVLDSSPQERAEMSRRCMEHPSGHRGTDFAVEIAAMLVGLARGEQ